MTEMHTPTLFVTGPGSLQGGLLALLTSIPQVDVIGEAQDALLALRMVNKYCPDLVVLNTNLPIDQAWKVLQWIKAQWPQIRCAVLVDDIVGLRLAEAMGADVVLMKGAPAARYIKEIEFLLVEGEGG